MKRNENLIQLARLTKEKNDIIKQINALEEQLEEVEDEIFEIDNSDEQQLNHVLVGFGILTGSVILSKVILMFLI